MADIAQLLRLLDGPRDGPLLRYALAAEYRKAGQADQAIAQLRVAVSRAPDHSASWKLLGTVLGESGDNAGALEAYRLGIDAAQRKGDVQAVKEMRVFARRIERRTTGSHGTGD